MSTAKKLTARAFGISFLIGYLSYGIGFGLLNTYLNQPDGLISIFKAKNQIVFEAAILMAVFATINIGLAMIMAPSLKNYNETFTYGYFGAAIVSTIMLIIGAVFLLLLIPISASMATATINEQMMFSNLAALCRRANFYCYQIGMIIWGFGGLFFCGLLLVSRLVPQWLSKWGLIGYVIFIAGAVLALFGFEVDVIMDIPGGLFEIYLSLRLIIKGFDSNANQEVPHAII